MKKIILALVFISNMAMADDLTKVEASVQINCDAKVAGTMCSVPTAHPGSLTGVAVSGATDDGNNTTGSH